MPLTIEDWKDRYYEADCRHREFIAMSGEEHRAAIARLEAENAALRDAGYMLAMALLQSDLWPKLAEDEKAAAELFLPKSQQTGREFKSPLQTWGGYCHRQPCHAVTKREECPGVLSICEGINQSSGSER